MRTSALYNMSRSGPTVLPRWVMPVQSYCFMLNGLSSDDVHIVRSVLSAESLMAKAAVLETVANVHRMEVVVDCENTMKYIAAEFKKRTKRKLTYKEDL